jgi:hypothetical protein
MTSDTMELLLQLVAHHYEVFAPLRPASTNAIYGVSFYAGGDNSDQGDLCGLFDLQHADEADCSLLPQLPTLEANKPAAIVLLRRGHYYFAFRDEFGYVNMVDGFELKKYSSTQRSQARTLKSKAAAAEATSTAGAPDSLSGEVQRQLACAFGQWSDSTSWPTLSVRLLESNYQTGQDCGFRAIAALIFWASVRQRPKPPAVYPNFSTINKAVALLAGFVDRLLLGDKGQAAGSHASAPTPKEMPAEDGQSATPSLYNVRFDFAATLALAKTRARELFDLLDKLAVTDNKPVPKAVFVVTTENFAVSMGLSTLAAFVSQLASPPPTLSLRKWLAEYHQTAAKVAAAEKSVAPPAKRAKDRAEPKDAFEAMMGKPRERHRSK